MLSPALTLVDERMTSSTKQLAEKIVSDPSSCEELALMRHFKTTGVLSLPVSEFTIASETPGKKLIATAVQATGPAKLL